MPRQRSYLATLLVFGSAILFVSGLLVLRTSFLAAGGEEETETKNSSIRPPIVNGRVVAVRTKVPRPDETSAMPISAARVHLSRNESLAAVIEAAESGDVTALLSLAKKSDDYCALLRELPPECEDRSDKVVVVFQHSSSDIPRPVATMRQWLTSLLEGNEVSLEFASRDSRFGEGDGGRYFLLFRTARAVDIDGSGGLDDNLLLTIVPGMPQPIESFAFGIPSANGLKWVQERGGEDGARYQILITPESVKDWPDTWGDKGD